MKFSRRNREVLEEPPEPVFRDPFPEEAVNTEALLELLGGNKGFGLYRTTVETVTLAIRPAIAKHTVSKVLTDTYVQPSSEHGNLRILDEYLDELIDPEILKRAEETLERQSPGLRYNRRLNAENNEKLEKGDSCELTIKQSRETITEFIYSSYAEVANDEEVRNSLVTEFETWVANRVSVEQGSYIQVVTNEAIL